MNQSTLEKQLASLPLGGVRYLDSTGSTNDVAAQWAAAGAPDLSLVVADEQTAGRGRLKRRWITPPGSALAISLVMRLVGTELESFPRLTALGALGLCGTLEERGLQPQIKWPNDVLLSGRKAAGLLAEAQWQGDQLEAVILGIGVNVLNAAVPPQSELLFPATSVQDVLGQPVDRWQLLHSLLAHLLEWRSQISHPEFLQAWEARLAYRGQQVQVLQITGDDRAQAASNKDFAEALVGTVLGLEPDGSLRLQTSDGSSVFLRTGELRLRPYS